MRVRGSWMSLLSWRAFSSAASQVDKSVARLSSGRRVNTAGDNAAGMGISHRLESNFRGLLQANRNALDGISLVQTAEATLAEVHAILQRGRELALRAANGTLTDSDRSSLQIEFNHLMTEIDRISDTATFNGIRLFSPPGGGAVVSQVVHGLRTGWLGRAEELVETYYGIVGDGTDIAIVLEESGPSAAWISGMSSPVDGRYEGLKLHINLSDFGNSSGTSGPMFNDRKVARALTQAILSRNSAYNQVDAWFRSGVADYIAGGDELVESALAQIGGQVQDLVDLMEDAATGTWVDDELHRASAYLAVKFLAQNIGTANMPAFFSFLQGNTLEDTLTLTYGSADVAGFVADFRLFGAGFVASDIDLTDPDVGGIGGGDAVDVIPDDAPYTENPLRNFEVSWPPMNRAMDIILQIGANSGQTLSFSIPEVSTYALNLLGLNVVNQAPEVVERMSEAIQKVTSVRSNLGSISNRLDHTINANKMAAESGISSQSRIVDLDVAQEMAHLTRQQIMVSSSGAMLAQANSMRQHVNWLLRGISGGSSSGGSSIMAWST